jgi:hypothetical protein
MPFSKFFSLNSFLGEFKDLARNRTHFLKMPQLGPHLYILLPLLDSVVVNTPVVSQGNGPERSPNYQKQNGHYQWREI